MKACKELTIIIPTFNSKKYIAILLGEVCKYVKTVIVIDSYSTDDTLEIAREFKNVTVLENEYVNSATQKNYALQHVSTKWAMFIDSDELPEDGLMDEIVSVVDNNKVGVNLVRIPRKNFFWGRYLGRAGNYPDYQSRILRVGYGKFQDKEVHAQIEIKDGAVESLTKALLHDDFTDIESLLIRNTRYYKYELDELKKTNVKWGVKLQFIKPIYVFVKIYFLKGGFKYGFIGFFWSVQWLIYHFMVAAKLYEYEKRSTKYRKIS